LKEDTEEEVRLGGRKIDLTTQDKKQKKRKVVTLYLRRTRDKSGKNSCLKKGETPAPYTREPKYPLQKKEKRKNLDFWGESRRRCSLGRKETKGEELFHGRIELARGRGGGPR